MDAHRSGKVGLEAARRLAAALPLAVLADGPELELDELALRRPFEHSPLPSYVPSILSGSP